MTYRIPKRRLKPRRKRPELFSGHQAVTLPKEEKAKRRAEIFARAGGRCQELVPVRDYEGYVLYWKRCYRRATDWSHKKHASKKCDCMDCGTDSCHECHMKRHAGGKPVPRKIVRKETREVLFNENHH